MDRGVTLHFRDQLRAARATALRDKEAFEEIVFVLERSGSQLSNKQLSLNEYLTYIGPEVARSPMAHNVPAHLPDFHQKFDVKYHIVRRARNAAVHQGAFARHLTANAVELSIVLEEGIMSECEEVSDFMVRDPVCAHLWQPLSFIRQTMLASSFSYLPVRIEKAGTVEWFLISDFQLGRCLRKKGKIGKSELILRLQDARESGQIDLHRAKICGPQDPIESVLQTDGMPTLVVSPVNTELLGIVTPFDLL